MSMNPPGIYCKEVIMKDLKVDDVIRDFFRNPEHFADMMHAI